jgi:hypothetical protein
MSRIINLIVVLFLSMAVLFAAAQPTFAGKPDGKGQQKQEERSSGAHSDPDNNGKGPERDDNDPGQQDTDDTSAKPNGKNDNGSGNEVDGDCDDNEGQCKAHQPKITVTVEVTPEPTTEVTPEPTTEVTPEPTVEITITPEVTPESTPESTPVIATPEITETSVITSEITETSVVTPVITVATPVVVTETHIVTEVVTVPATQCAVSACQTCCNPCSDGRLASPELPSDVYVTNNVDTMPIAIAIVLAGALIALAYTLKK